MPPLEDLRRSKQVRSEAEKEMTAAFDWYENLVPGLGFEFLLCMDAIFSSLLRSP
jgi:hypothetical protein